MEHVKTSDPMLKEILGAYVEAGENPVDNNALYARLQMRLDLDDADVSTRARIAGSDHNLFKRSVRWFQQTLKQAGVIERVEGERGVWRYTRASGKELNQVDPEVSLLGFSTDLGVAILGSCSNVFSRIDEPIHLILTSPPYPLRNPRNYGNASEPQYVDWICRTIEPLIRNMADGASLCLNIGNEIFLPGMPARSMYQERLVLALADRFGLYKMDTLIWENTTKPPGPIQYASKQRAQLNAGYEPIIWMTNNPHKVYSNNQRVLQPHSERHLKLIAQGGEQRERSNSDGAYRILKGAYGNPTAGKIQRNVISMAHSCRDQQLYKAHCRAIGITPHGATMPLRLAKLLIEFLTERYQLVVDPFAGSFTVPKAAEELLRRWMGTDNVLEYVMGSAYRFRSFPGYRAGAI